ncbi:unnamed protein product [Cladocopium goreaui]|uniref:FHA domain-containing protein n=1 Tax=Cladocopium goreaui TaxID=2562237 RepID=A0A9P1G825_9DINO|nr:unnamed protein product [Cladocopium goreaui]
MVDPIGRRKLLRLAMAGDGQLCVKGLREDNRASAVAASRLHFTRLGPQMAPDGYAVADPNEVETGFLLDLPLKWISGWPEGQKQYPQKSGSVWFDFPALWGEVLESLIVHARDPAVVHLLVNFASAEGAKTMFELLHGRYVYNPAAEDDTYPVRCLLGHYQDLRLYAEGQKALEGRGFVLRRRGAPETGVPQVIEVNQRRLTLGREEEFANVVIQKPHISKAHAVLELVAGTLSIQDTSVNGTWVNEHRLANGIRVELHPFDKVSFLPAGHPGAPRGTPGTLHGLKKAAHPAYKEALVYEVRPAEEAREAPRSRTPERRRNSDAIDVRPHTAPLSALASLAEPVGLAKKRKVVALRGVVQIDDDEDVARVSPEKDELLEAEDVDRWARQLDGGSLVEYIPKLTSLFDSVSQIKKRYSGKLNDFYEDVQVQDENHRLAFASALRVRGASVLGDMMT